MEYLLEDTNKNISYIFGSYRLQKKPLTLFSNEQKIKIEPQVVQLLLFFVENADTVLSRDDIIAYLWPKRVVTDDALRSSVRKLRDILQDSAKSPEYIKTLPMKGYEFIAQVELLTPEKEGTKNSAQKTTIAVCLITILIILIISLLWSNESVKPPYISKLTTISGSELLPSFDPIHNRIIFAHRANKNDFLQFYVKDMSSGDVTRLTWDNANYGNAMWSPDGTSFAYIRSTPTEMHHFISEFDPKQGMVNTTQLENDILSTHYLLGWSRNKHAIYLTDKTSPTSPQGIWLYDITRNTVEQISSPSVPGQGDYFAKESYDGSQLAILRSISLNKHELLVLHIKTGQIVFSAQLPNKMHRLVWQQNDKSITVGNFEGDLYRVDLNTASANNLALENITPQADYVNNVFYQCGEQCYYMRQHNGNYLDIAEQPNPFIKKYTGSFAKYELKGANDFPMYANLSEKLYFVSHYGQSTLIEYMQNTTAPATLLDFKKVTDIQSIALNETDTHFVGLADSTLFTYSIADKKLSYLSKQTDIVYPPHWLNEHSFVYAKLEKNQAMLYQYSLLDNTSTFLMSDFVGLIELPNNTRLLIDKDFHLWHEQHQQLRNIAKLPSSQANRIEVVDDMVFYTGREENNSFLYRVNINSGHTDKFEIAKNRFKANFDMSENQEKLAVVESLLAQSDLIKLELN